MNDPLQVPDPDLTDGRVTLRPWRMQDLPALVDGGSDPLVQRFRYSVPDSAGAARRWLQQVERDRSAGRRLELAITETARSSTALGSVSLTDLEYGAGAIRYWLLPAARGRGTGAAAVRLLAAWAIETLGIVRIELRIEPDNAPSQRLAERCGFVLEGRLRSHWEDRDGRRHDLLIYGLLPGELR